MNLYILVHWLCYILYYIHYTILWGFPSGSAGKESTCNAGDTGNKGLIPGSGRSPGGGNGNLFQYSCKRISRTEGSDGLQSIGSQRIRHYGVNEHSSEYYTILPYTMLFSSVQFSSVVQSCLTLCDPHGLQHTRPPHPSPTPRVHPNPCTLSQ